MPSGGRERAESGLTEAEQAAARRASLDYGTVLGPRQVVGGFALIAALVLVVRAILARRRKD